MQWPDCECHLVDVLSYYVDMSVLCQELEKPSPPQKPLPADPRSSRLVRSPSAVQGHSVIQGPPAAAAAAPAPAGPKPMRPVPHPKR